MKWENQEKSKSVLKPNSPGCKLLTFRFTTYPFQTEIWASTPPNRGRFGGILLICISMNKTSWKKFLHWKLLDNICSSGLKANHQTKSYISLCVSEIFSCSTFPFFCYFWTTNEIFWKKWFSTSLSSVKKFFKLFKKAHIHV